MGQKAILMRTLKQGPFLVSLIFTCFPWGMSRHLMLSAIRISVVPTKIKERFCLMKTAASNVQLIFIKLEKKQKQKHPSAAIWSPSCVFVSKCMWCTPACGVFSCGAAVTLRYKKKAASPGKRSQHCSYMQANQLVRFGKNTKMVTWTLYWYKKKLKKLLKKSQNI